MRVAFLGPLPPEPTGIADYAADVLHAIDGAHEVDAVHAQEAVDAARLPPSVTPIGVAEFLARHAARPYDAVVHQMGNGPAHAFLYPLLARVPGLLVLHELVLHHARARMLLDGPEARAYAAAPDDAARRDAAMRRVAEYEAEAAYSHPGQAGRLAPAHLGTVGRLLPYAYPLVRLPVEASRVVGAHNVYTLDAVREQVPGVVATRLVMPVEAAQVGPAAVDELRRRYGITSDETVVASFGLLTPEKQPLTVARAFARAAVASPGLRLLLVGPVPDEAALRRDLAAAGVAARVTVTGRVPFAELAAHVELADVVAHLRYPTARETSAALLRVLAQGRATVVSDLEHLADLPPGAVVRADPADEEGELTRALIRLAADPARRRRLGDAAAAFVRAEHSPSRCRESYESALRLTAAAPDPAPRDWPPHWTAPPRPA